MNFIQKIQEQIIRHFYFPFQLKRSVNFNDAIQHVNHVLVYCPELTLIDEIDQKLKGLFKNVTINYILPIEKKQNLSINTKVTHIHYLYKNSIAKTQKSKQYKTLIKLPADLFIDLDIKFNLLNIFLCRLLHPTICLSYHKQYSQHYYNLQYRTNSYHPIPERFKNIYKILSLLVAQ